MASIPKLSGQSTPTNKANHTVFLVHGLWGNATHLSFVAQALQDKYSEEELIVVACRSNPGSLTYDGIEVGAERVAREIEEKLDELNRHGYKITRFSIVGYSLGGLVARYAIGLLYHKGYFDKLTPVNFTTFVTPHLGVRTPLIGYSNHLWNVLGARTLSTSGRQLFTIDSFRSTGRPLLSVLADPQSVFISALAKFEHRSLYTNIVNDLSAVFYTTGISRCDPFTNLSKVDLRYVKGYEPVILDPDNPVERKSQNKLPSFYERFRDRGRTFLGRIPIYLALLVIVPIATVAFLINSGIQTFRSRRRIQLHETDPEGAGFGVYRIPYMVREMRVGLEDAFENMNSAQEQEYLPEGSQELASTSDSISSSPYLSRLDDLLEREKSDAGMLKKEPLTSERPLDFPTLALTSDQFAMIKSLNDVGFRKYPVHITKSSHSHAAIIVRTPRSAFEEGKVVVKHWLENEFHI
ncbi:uncharacterized protein A1O9_08663 [Exophiala aquamarina CBS 119918]|uniref:DUF676 domain-containing protein n=1 Tax=Exophiala aquamarina CBS 119918 TaxID=1182545 RepID=A0A072PHI8_9EURO|nr:uncharacterized protein A1O9_08663 [Exophiala aquamarina CBS 119918]KEF55010.1 hypothetical protein A1O9_08663 [Exophiala aquamarina CBS 119918]